MSRSKNVALIAKECVACGACMKVCPIGAVSVYKGMYAIVNGEKCIGCGKCVQACPASVISVVLRGGVEAFEEALV